MKTKKIKRCALLTWIADMRMNELDRIQKMARDFFGPDAIDTEKLDQFISDAYASGYQKGEQDAYRESLKK
jgi:hypothetical protein